MSPTSPNDKLTVATPPDPKPMIRLTVFAAGNSYYIFSAEFPDEAGRYEITRLDPAHEGVRSALIHAREVIDHMLGVDVRTAPAEGAER